MEWRVLHNEGLNDRYCSANGVRGIKLREMGWVGHVALWGGQKCIQSFGGET